MVYLGSSVDLKEGIRKKKNSFCSLDIRPYFPFSRTSDAWVEQTAQIRKTLGKIFPESLLISEKNDVIQWINRSLPIVKGKDAIVPPECLSIYLFCKLSKHIKAENIFFEMIKRWLIPEKEVRVLSFQNLYFHLPEVSGDLFFASEIKVLIEDGRDLTSVQTNFPHLCHEIILAITSTRYTGHILETKALSQDQKTSLIHYELIRAVQRQSAIFDGEIFVEMGRFFALSHAEFKKLRTHRHIARLIISHYFMRRKVVKALNVYPEKRHLELRFIQVQLHFPFGSKRVLGIPIGIGLFEKNESFDENHILSAVQQLVQGAQLIKDSFYVYQMNQDPIRLFYVEFEKKDGSAFTGQEMRALKRALKEELEKRIEKLIPSVFMIRNEEEIMKNILLLSYELKYISDLPQVMISFDKQTVTDLFFTVILVRVLKKQDESVERSFLKISGPLQFIPERVQIVGYLRKKIPKEANVFHLRIPKEKSILRTDSSVNFYFARQKVVSLLHQVFGEIRDFNGGMISKQNELFSRFKKSFSEIAEKNPELLENFFFSLNPIEAQATLPISSLESLFQICLKALDQELSKKDNCFFQIHHDKSVTFVVVRARDFSIRENLSEVLNLFDPNHRFIIKTQVAIQGTVLLAYIYESQNSEDQNKFSSVVEHAIKDWVLKIKNQQILRLSFLDLPPSLDPRLGGDEISGTVLKMLYDGLMRIGNDSKPVLSIADSVDISADFKRYTFKLRECYWSNESRIMAYDFEYAWKKILSPEFNTPFAYFFYPIKNAKAAKEGTCSLDHIGVKSLDETTLIVELEYPCQEFLELTAHTLYSPVSHIIDKNRPNWSQEEGDAYICNGPFKLKKHRPRVSLELEKNPIYWDKKVVKLDRILISKSDSDVANEMFKRDETDWIGRPMRPWEPFFSQGSDEIVCASSLGTYWCVCNVERFPFHHPKIRQAISYAIDRGALIQELAEIYDGLPAMTPLPLPHTQNYDRQYIHGDPFLAVRLFEEALKELKLTREKFPITSLIYTFGNAREKAIKLITERLQNVLGIQLRPEGYDFNVVFAKMMRGDFHIGTMFWKSWINDPIYTLNSFKYRNNKVNFSKWEHAEYQTLLNQAQQAIDPIQRLVFLKKAEKILMIECPVISLFYEIHQYMHKKYLKDAFHSDTGNVDFKNASIAMQNKNLSQ